MCCYHSPCVMEQRNLPLIVSSRQEKNTDGATESEIEKEIERAEDAFVGRRFKKKMQILSIGF